MPSALTPPQTAKNVLQYCSMPLLNLQRPVRPAVQHQATKPLQTRSAASAANFPVQIKDLDCINMFHSSSAGADETGLCSRLCLALLFLVMSEEYKGTMQPNAYLCFDRSGEGVGDCFFFVCKRRRDGGRIECKYWLPLRRASSFPAPSGWRHGDGRVVAAQQKLTLKALCGIIRRDIPLQKD